MVFWWGYSRPYPSREHPHLNQLDWPNRCTTFRFSTTPKWNVDFLALFSINLNSSFIGDDYVLFQKSAGWRLWKRPLWLYGNLGCLNAGLQGFKVFEVNARWIKWGNYRRAIVYGLWFIRGNWLELLRLGKCSDAKIRSVGKMGKCRVLMSFTVMTELD